MSDDSAQQAHLRALALSEQLQRRIKRIAARAVQELGAHVTETTVLAAFLRTHRQRADIAELATVLRLTLTTVAKFANAVDHTDPAYDFASGLLAHVCPVLDAIPEHLEEYVPPPPEDTHGVPASSPEGNVDELLEGLAEPPLNPDPARTTLVSSFPPSIVSTAPSDE